MPIRNREREQYIYNARKFDKRTYADIGRDLGITWNRVRQIYVRRDWEINRFNADHHLKKAKMNQYMKEHMATDTEEE